MAKYFGGVGYRETVETEPGIWKDVVTERPHYGDVLKNYVRNDTNREYTTTIKSPTCNNSISIVADPYAFENFHNIVYATYMGTKWVVTTVEVQYPRLLLTLGGVYDGPDPIDSSSETG